MTEGKQFNFLSAHCSRRLSVARDEKEQQANFRERRNLRSIPPTTVFCPRMVVVKAAVDVVIVEAVED
ncbi:hypothetical protein Pmani_036611 [Petrolisthes manimaculis]|uniref:Uncharacterized protein n=1 Tax=Petrolisthes manimaculis TaxID=1843537 RepID=A0AAE1NID5_9EUCA|nr:hypothetical protein Pmani_036611 [Petrolisthes manimaculis]